ncbi:MAG TPA: DUF4387 domain-containing protein [Bacillota bacterium]|nr:DUF4387 domain-containing protein [Bacillota bacterium]HQL37179.1 DUF4387 domain-containing protein [Bacillota bacterium]
MKKYRLHDIAAVIRSKNSGPYELTFDILMKDDETFEKVASADIFSKKLISELYNLPEDDIQSIIKFPKARAFKITVKRPIPSGALGDRDIYGAQQHAPLMDLSIEL